jgi:hypothetical protein
MKFSSFALSLLAAALAATPLVSRADLGVVATTNGQLVSFDLSTPASSSSVAVTGFTGGESYFVELAFNRGNGTLYGLGNNANLYSVNQSTGAATLITSALSPAGFNGALAVDPFLFSSLNLRYVTDANESYSITNGSTIVTNAPLNFATGDVNDAATPFFVGLGIDQDFGTVFAIDSNLDILATSGDPLFVDFTTVGSLGINVGGVASVDLDGEGNIYAVLTQDLAIFKLYGINATTGAASELFTFTGGVEAFATVSAIPEPSTYAAILGGLVLTFSASRRRQRATV